MALTSLVSGFVGRMDITNGSHTLYQIAAIATQMKYIQSSDYKKYILNVQRNARTLANAMIDLGYKITTVPNSKYVNVRTKEMRELNYL